MRRRRHHDEGEDLGRDRKPSGWNRYAAAYVYLLDMIDMNPGSVRSLAKKSMGVGDLVQPGVTELSDGWLPSSEPSFKSTLLLCRQKWIFTFTGLRDATRTIGDKLNASANAVDSADVDSADQF